MHFRYYLRYATVSEREKLCEMLELSYGYLKQIAYGYSKCKEARQLSIINAVYAISGKLISFDEHIDFLKMKAVHR